MNSLTLLLTLLTQLATLAAVIVAAVQLTHTRKTARSTFEDSLDREYRALIRNIPTRAMLGCSLSLEEQREAFDTFYQYFDLTNNQIFLFKVGRISGHTMQFWFDGMQANLNRPAFKAAWKAVIETNTEEHFSDFQELQIFKRQLVRAEQLKPQELKMALLREAVQYRERTNS
jgi:hypothetical protein